MEDLLVFSCIASRVPFSPTPTQPVFVCIQLFSYATRVADAEQTDRRIDVGLCVQLSEPNEFNDS